MYHFESTYLFILLLTCFIITSLAQESKPLSKIYTGADQTQLYISKLKGKKMKKY